MKKEVWRNPGEYHIAPRHPKPTNKQLTALGLSRSYASELANGHKTPSLAVALKIEREIGYPVSAWQETAA